MKTSESVKAISEALVKAHAKMTEVKKNMDNPFTKSEYADLSAVVEVTRPVLAGEKLCVLQCPAFRDGTLYVTSRVIHESGEWMEEDSSAGVIAQGPAEAGKAITYLRRYALLAICGIAPKDDDASQSEFSRKKKGKSPASATVNKVLAGTAQGEKSIEAIVKAFPPKVKEKFAKIKVFSIFDQHKAYKACAGDLDALDQYLDEKIRNFAR